MIVGEAGINIDDMDVGKTAAGRAALMAISTTSPVPPEVVEHLRSERGVVDARAIDF
jgi:D-3-phosphoglycerate dehydrogenase